MLELPRNADLSVDATSQDEQTVQLQVTSSQLTSIDSPSHQRSLQEGEMEQLLDGIDEDSLFGDF